MADTDNPGSFSVDTRTQLVKNLLAPATNNVRPGPFANEPDPAMAALSKHLEGLREDMKSQIEANKAFGDQVVGLFRELSEARKTTSTRSRKKLKDVGSGEAVEGGTTEAAEKLQNQDDPINQLFGSGGKQKKKVAVKDSAMIGAFQHFTKVYAKDGKVKLGVDKAVEESVAATAAAKLSPEEREEREGGDLHDPHDRLGSRMMYDKRYGSEMPFLHKSSFSPTRGKEMRFHPHELMQDPYRPHLERFRQHFDEYDRKMAQHAFHHSKDPKHIEQGANPALAGSTGMASFHKHHGVAREGAALAAEAASGLKTGFMGLIGMMDDEWRREMRKTAYQTEGVSENDKGSQDAYLGGKWRGDITAAIAITGRSNEEVKAMMLKNLRTGYRDSKDSFRMTKVALNASYVMGMQMEATNEYFKELHWRMGMSTAALAAVSTSMQSIGRELKVTGDALLDSFRAASGLVKDSAKAGRDTIARTNAYNEMVTRFMNNGKLDVTESGVKVLKAMGGLQDFMHADAKTRAFLLAGLQNDVGGTLNRKLMNGSMVTDKSARRELVTEIGKTLSRQVSQVAVSPERLKEVGVMDAAGKVRELHSSDLDKFTHDEMMKLDLYFQNIHGMGAKEALVLREQMLEGSKTLQERTDKMRLDAKDASPERKADVEKDILKMRQQARTTGVNQAEDMLGNTKGGTVDDMLKEYAKTPKFKEMVDQLKEITPGAAFDTNDQIKQGLFKNLKDAATSVGDNDVMKKVDQAIASGNKGELQAAMAALSEAQAKKDKETVASKDPMENAMKFMEQVIGLLTNIRDSLNAIVTGIIGSAGIIGLAIGAGIWKAWSALGFMTKFGFGGGGAGGWWKKLDPRTWFGRGAGTPAPGAPGAGGGGGAPGAPGGAAPGAAPAGGSWWSKLNPKNWFGRGAAGAPGAGGAAAPGIPGATPGAGALKWGGRILGVVGVALDAIGRFGKAKETEEAFARGDMTAEQRETSHAGNVAGFAGGVGGMVVGGKIGAGAGAWIGGIVGSIVPGLGTAIGAAVGAGLGGIVGGGLGYFGGSKLGQWLGEQVWTPFKDFVVGVADWLWETGKSVLGWFADIGKKINQAIGEWINGIWESIFGKKEKSAEEKAQEKSTEAQKAAGTYYAHDDVRNVKKNEWAAADAKEKEVAKGLEDMNKSLVPTPARLLRSREARAGDKTRRETEFNTKAEETLTNTLAQTQRYGTSGRDDWTGSLKAVQEAKDKGFTLSPQVERMFQDLSRKNDIDWRKAGVRDEMTRSGVAIGKNGMTKELWEQRVEAEATKRYEAAKVAPGGVPKLAEGGLVTSGGLAIVGEAGPEWVIPAERFGATVDPLPPSVGSATWFSDADDVPRPTARPQPSSLPLTTVHEQVEQAYGTRETGDGGGSAVPELGQIAHEAETQNDKLDELIRLMRVLVGSLAGDSTSGNTGGRKVPSRSKVVPPASPNFYNLPFGLRETPTKAFVNNYH